MASQRRLWYSSMNAFCFSKYSSLSCSSTRRTSMQWRSIKGWRRGENRGVGGRGGTFVVLLRSNSSAVLVKFLIILPSFSFRFLFLTLSYTHEPTLSILCNNSEIVYYVLRVLRSTYIAFVFEEHMEVDVFAERGVGSQALEKHLVHGHRLFEGGQVLLFELVLHFDEFIMRESLLSFA